jgi:hypothetical protein
LTCSFVPALVDDDDSDPADDNDPSVQDDTILNGLDQHVPSILGRLALVPVGETGTIPYSMRKEATSFKGAACDSKLNGADGNRWWYVNTLALKWATSQ